MNFIVTGLEKMKIYFFVGRATLILSSILYLDDETDLHYTHTAPMGPAKLEVCVCDCTSHTLFRCALIVSVEIKPNMFVNKII